MEICGYAYQRDPVDRPARLAVVFDTSPTDGDYRVIDVDYERFAVVYSCTQLLFFKLELGWILTRRPNVNASLIDVGRTAFERNNISPDLTVVEHPGSCTYDPATRCIDSENGLRSPGHMGSTHGIFGWDRP